MSDEHRDQVRRRSEGRRKSDRDVRNEINRLDALVKALVTLAALCCVAAIVSLVVSVTTSQNRKDLVDVKSLTQQIQQERADATLASCHEQNDQHDDTIARYDADVIERLTGRPQRFQTLTGAEAAFKTAMATLPRPARKQAQDGHDFIVDVVQGLRPKRDCDKLVRTNVKAG